MSEYVIAKAYGRGASRAPYHLIGSDGSDPLCGMALRRLDLFRVIPVSDVGKRKLCSRCRRIGGLATVEQWEASGKTRGR